MNRELIILYVVNLILLIKLCFLIDKPIKKDSYLSLIVCFVHINKFNLKISSFKNNYLYSNT